MMTVNWFRAPAPVARRVRAYFAPVNRATQTPVHFDPAAQGDFALDSPPTPWVDLGWIQNFTRKSTSKTAPLLTGIPAAPLDQVRETLEAHVSFEFFSWTKLTMALATGSQHMNLLTGGAVEAQQGSTASLVQLGTGEANNFAAGSMIAVDADYSGQTGFVGAPISGAYVRQPIADQDYIRRVTFNVGLVASASVGDDQKVKVHRLVAAVDCGHVVNSSVAAQQIEAGLIWALAQATVPAPEWISGMPRGRPVGALDLPRLGDAPEVVVQMIPSSESPGGISGLGTLALAPAVANAIHAASGKRMRSLPFDPMAAS